MTLPTSDWTPGANANLALVTGIVSARRTDFMQTTRGSVEFHADAHTPTTTGELV